MAMWLRALSQAVGMSFCVRWTAQHEQVRSRQDGRVRTLGYRQAIEQAEEYIAAHLTDELDPADVAQRSGYSYFHFCHVFRAVTGRGLSRYILEKRMGLAKTLLAGGKSVTYAATEVGFSTAAGFTRAFTRLFGIPPSKYRASMLSAGRDVKGEGSMQPTIIKKPSFKVSCLVIRPESEVDILENGGYWIGREIPELAASSHEEAFAKAEAKVGAWMHDADAQELYYVYGDVLEDGADAAFEKVIEFPEAEYAVFEVPTASTHVEFVENLRVTWKYIFNEWFDSSAYKFNTDKMDFEYYTLEGVSIYVPVLAK